MKIEVNSGMASQLLAERTAKQTATTSSTASVQSPTVDRTTLSSNSSVAHSLAGLAMKSPEVRQDKVDALSQSISSGQYAVEPAKIADAIVQSSSK